MTLIQGRAVAPPAPLPAKRFYHLGRKKCYRSYSCIPCPDLCRGSVMRRRYRLLSCLLRSRHALSHLGNLELLEARCLLSATMSEYLIPTNSSHPTAIVAGPDGALWFTESDTTKIGR